MVKITLITNNPKVVDIVRETMTVREFLEEHDVNYAMGTTSLDGNPLNTMGLDSEFGELGVTERAILSCLPNKDNAAKAYVMGSSCVIASKLTPEEITKIAKYRPEALKLYDDKGELCFKVMIDPECPGSLGGNGACFGNAVNKDGKATITIMIDPTLVDPLDMVVDKLGVPMYRLNQVENQAKNVLNEIKAEETVIDEMFVKM